MQEKIVTSGSQTTEYLTFLYNGEGPTGIVYNNTIYTYRKNLFGDIIAIYQGNTKVTEYAYGNCTIKLDTVNVATLNHSVTVVTTPTTIKQQRIMFTRTMVALGIETATNFGLTFWW